MSTRIEIFNPGPYQTNCYLISAEGSQACDVIDAGFEAHRMFDRMDTAGLKPRRLILTHTHVDHIAGVAEFRRRFPGVPVLVHEAEAGFLSAPELNLSIALGKPISIGEADTFLHHDDELILSGEKWRVIHVPGHSPGSIALYNAKDSVVIAGDALFAGSIGRTDFPTSDHETLIESIRERLYVLPDATTVLPGHGPQTTIGREAVSNPFVRR